MMGQGVLRLMAPKEHHEAATYATHPNPKRGSNPGLAASTPDEQARFPTPGEQVCYSRVRALPRTLTLTLTLTLDRLVGAHWRGFRTRALCYVWHWAAIELQRSARGRQVRSSVLLALPQT